MSTERTEGWSIVGLAAYDPLPELKEELMLFGQFVGDWEIYEGRYLKPDGSWAKETGEVHWRWVLEGRGVQDVWMFYDPTRERMVPAGTTVRFYDAKIDAWHSIWISPLQGFVKSFIGRKDGDGILLEGSGPEGELLRWSFSEIGLGSFTWRSEVSRDGGRSWAFNEEMHARRLANRTPRAL